jgi:hypothetical protein
MFHHYFAEQQIAFRERELRAAAERAGMRAGARPRSARRRGTAGMARMLRNVADKLDASS